MILPKMTKCLKPAVQSPLQCVSTKHDILSDKKEVQGWFKSKKRRKGGGYFLTVKEFLYFYLPFDCHMVVPFLNSLISLSLSFCLCLYLSHKQISLSLSCQFVH